MPKRPKTTCNNKACGKEIYINKELLTETMTEETEMTEKNNNREIMKLMKFINDFFKNNIEYLLENEAIDKFIEKNEDKFNKIEEMIINA